MSFGGFLSSVWALRGGMGDVNVGCMQTAVVGTRSPEGDDEHGTGDEEKTGRGPSQDFKDSPTRGA